MAFGNILTAQSLLRRADGEVAAELQGLKNTQQRLQAELDQARQLWKQGQTTDRVSEKSAGLRDDLETGNRIRV